MSLIGEEVRGSTLPDARLKERLEFIVERLAAQPEASIPQAMGSWAGTKATYRFFDSEVVTIRAIQAGHIQSCTERAKAHSTVLIVQDTTTLDFTDHPQTEGLGHLDTVKARGLVVHTALAVTPEGVPLGLLAEDVWTRDVAKLGQRHDRRKRPFTEKESIKWVNALDASARLLCEVEQTVTIADSEADVFELFVAQRPDNAQLLIRATHDRRVQTAERYLWETVEKEPISGEVVVEVAAREGHAARQAKCSVRFRTVVVKSPRNQSPGASPVKEVTLQAVLVKEEDPPEGVEALCWLLLTTLSVENFDDAVRCAEWYGKRWLVERYHMVLKSGCRVERLQLEKADRIQRALAVYSLVAWRLLWLTYEARQSPDAPCDCVLEAHQWQSLYCRIHKTTTPPEQPPTLRDAVRWIAQLGGFMGRKRDGEPGVIVIWRGLRRLEDISDTWLLLHPQTRCG